MYVVIEISYPRVSQRALNRWCVAYTLITNPNLVEFTASHLALNKENQKRKKCQMKANQSDSDLASRVTQCSVADDRTRVFIEVKEEPFK